VFLSAFPVLPEADEDKDQSHNTDAEMPGEEDEAVCAAGEIVGKGQTFHKLCDCGACLTEQQNDADGEEFFG